MAGKDFFKGLGIAAGLAVIAGAAVYVTKKTMEYMADKNELCDDDECGCDCGNYINMPVPDDEDFTCEGECDACSDADICECATCTEEDCDNCWADREEQPEEQPEENKEDNSATF